MRRIEIAKILRNESDFLAKYFLSNPSEISNFNRVNGYGQEGEYSNIVQSETISLKYEVQLIAN